MTHFMDGPAVGVVLQLKYSPIVLRVVRDADGNWDALDVADDLARPGESIFLYELVHTPGVAFIDYRDKAGRRRGCRCAIAEYRLVPEQPSDTILRVPLAWAEWCDANQERLLAEFRRRKAQSPQPATGH